MQPPGGARLSLKPLPKNLILRVRCRQQLHCHHAVHDGVLGLIYLAGTVTLVSVGDLGGFVG
jgi:hypothetical protein